MEWVFKALILSLTAGLFSLVLERIEPGIAMLIGVMATVLVIVFSAQVLQPVLRFLEEANRVCSLSGIYTQPLLKCTAIALITRFGTALCKDAKQTGAAAALGFLGTAAAIWTCLPLMEAFLSMLESVL